ncbi:MAG: purine-nucleoside phosphorylase [Erysipelotrichaceae bacterium]|nr:purine-nucleoside phosphorylase [Erysipelotrichaceae bacterium]
MEDLYELASRSAAFLSNYVTGVKVALILGSGLQDLIDKIENPVKISYGSIPNFPLATVSSHENQMIIGVLDGVKIMIMAGRFHYYEGYTMKEVTYPLFVFKLLGIPRLIITNACGAINEQFQPGDLMIITDFINLAGTNPLIGVNDERFGPRFPDMSNPYSADLVATAKKCARDLNITYREGVYGGFMGPCYETAAEIRAFRTLGVDAIGMSTVPETIVANYLGIETIAIGCITNMATGIQKGPHSHERVVAMAKQSSTRLGRWIEAILMEL